MGCTSSSPSSALPTSAPKYLPEVSTRRSAAASIPLASVVTPATVTVPVPVSVPVPVPAAHTAIPVAAPADLTSVVPVAAPASTADPARPPALAAGAATATRIRDRAYGSMSELQDEMAACGLEAVNMVVAIDFTCSNKFTGRVCRRGLSLHHHTEDDPSPYARVIRLMATVMADRFDVDGIVPMLGFGDSRTNHRYCFSLGPSPMTGLPVQVMMQRYQDTVQRVALSGPTSFAAVVAHTCDIVAASGYQYHVLVIITDGVVQDDGETLVAIRAAAAFPLSIVVVGVGDGPFDSMRQLDDGTPGAAFDNVQFVQYVSSMDPVQFCKQAAAEIVQQYQAIKRLGLMRPYHRAPLFTTGDTALMFPRPSRGFCLPVACDSSAAHACSC